ncbi:hypothetical protein D7X74_13175 [Corallococcus sp. CA047B]|uniref:hypothetical protein n=1 Tax=Corallococcus sp. CA047B TaxID=2316729 RepID=UPI000EA357F8|nr:hypothetical protein [Corallococcus sp. CA047B]RKH17219.1 hypothetical protein D7X74_13175 [Corallococcus sp. CA047B]
MTGPKRGTLVANVLCLGALGWLYGGELADALRIRTAEVSAVTSSPSVGRAGTVLGLTAVGLVVLGVGLLRKQPEGFKGYRLLPILLVGALFLDLVLSEGRSPLDAEAQAAVALRNFHEAAQKQATPEAVPVEARVLQPIVDALGTPPYRLRGVQVPSYALQVRRNCEGPARDASGTRPGTLLYCVASDGKQAWVTLVGLPAGVRFGAPGLFSTRGEPRFSVVRARSPEENDAEPAIELELPEVDSDGEAASDSP